MTTAIDLARLVLVAVFAAAGAAKLSDRPGTRAMVAQFGLGERPARAVAALLPLAELAAAGALVVAATAWWGALAAALLLAVFAAAMVIALRAGRAPECRCFGQARVATVGRRTVIRNLGLLGVAATVLSAGPRARFAGATAWLSGLDAVQRTALAGAVAVAAVGALGVWACWGLLREHGRLLARIDALSAGAAPTAGPDGRPPVARPPLIVQGLPAGSAAPSFTLPRADGTPGSLGDLVAGGRPAVLVFAQTGCGPCTALLPQVRAWQQEHAGRLTVAVICAGDAARARGLQQDHELDHFLLDEDREVSSAYAIGGTPGAVLVDEDGWVASAIHAGAASVAQLVNRSRPREPRLEVHHV